jgi:hypothetical protein
VDSVRPRSARRLRRRPPLRSYIPFALLTGSCFLLVAALVLLLVRVAFTSGHGSASIAKQPARHVAATLAVAVTHAPTYLPTVAVTHAPTYPPATAGSTAVGSMMAVGVPLVSPTPAAIIALRTLQAPPKLSATPKALARIVVARGVEGDQPVQAANRFMSPALRLYAVARVKNVRASDSLRFIFKRNGLTLPRDDITLSAGAFMNHHAFLPLHAFTVWADYQRGAQPLPPGDYRVVFLRNGILEAQTAFRVG